MITIIGTGLAGYQLARELRKCDSHVPLMLITADDGRFYPKPQLSTALAQKKTPETLATATAETMATQLQATIRTQCQVKHIDPIKKQLIINQEHISYEKLILACGADAIKPEIKGDAAQEMLSINHIYHYAAFAALIKDKKHITILGAGLIGCEFANDLTNAHYEVHIIAPDKTPLERFVPEKIGTLLQKALEKNGVHFHLNNTVHAIDYARNNFRYSAEDRMSHGCDIRSQEQFRLEKSGGSYSVHVPIDHDKKEYRLQLANGEMLYTEFVLSAIGLKPHIALAVEAGIKTNRGILVNRYLETNIENIYAIGDCAEVEGHVLPFISPILNCSKALAKTLTGIRTPVEYPAMPITVKTPVHPIVICPPPMHVAGSWEIDIHDNNARALFYDDCHQLYGFVLTNEAVKDRLNLTKQIPSLF